MSTAAETRLTGRVAIVTGSAAGLGRAIVEMLAGLGVAVVIADRDLAGAKRLEQDIADNGGTAMAVETDVIQAASLECMSAAAIARFGHVDLLVNNAGMLGPIRPLWETTDEEVDRVYSLNVKSVFACTRLVARHMMQRRTGAIVTIASGSRQGRTAGHVDLRLEQGCCNRLHQIVGKGAGPARRAGQLCFARADRVHGNARRDARLVQRRFYEPHSHGTARARAGGGTGRRLLALRCSKLRHRRLL
jgi:NAD(P)-dependent dehydrogenase (short-subunit alcohol dehydrogenase family)